MKKHTLLKKGFVLYVIAIFIGMSITSIAGNNAVEDILTFNENFEEIRSPTYLSLNVNNIDDPNSEINWEIGSYEGDAYAFDPNNPPNTPSQPDGLDFVCLWLDDYFSTFTTDPDGDNVSYGWDWDGDQVVDEWTGWYESGENCTISHSWDQGGWYYTRVKAKDTFEYESEWSDPLFIDVGSCWPPGTPSYPDPEDEETDVEIDVILNWWTTDPYPNAILTHDIYFGTNPDPPYVETIGPYLVGENTWYDPGILEYNTTYYWQIVACHWGGACQESYIWDFTTEGEPVSDLDCNGDLDWVDIKPGSTVTGEFYIENIGEPTSSLDWEIYEYPSEWGTWTFNPSSGENLHPEDGNFIVDVTVIVPEDQNAEFDGEIAIINTNDLTDFCSISVCLATQKNQSYPILEFLRYCFPLLFQIIIQYLI